MDVDQRRRETDSPPAQSAALKDGDNCGVLGRATSALNLPAPR